MVHAAGRGVAVSLPRSRLCLPQRILHDGQSFFHVRTAHILMGGKADPVRIHGDAEQVPPAQGFNQGGAERAVVLKITILVSTAADPAQTQQPPALGQEAGVGMIRPGDPPSSQGHDPRGGNDPPGAFYRRLRRRAAQSIPRTGNQRPDGGA